MASMVSEDQCVRYRKRVQHCGMDHLQPALMLVMSQNFTKARSDDCVEVAYLYSIAKLHSRLRLKEEILPGSPILRVHGQV